MSEQSIEETLEEIRPLLRLIVRERIGAQTWLADDAEQEALLAAWSRLAEGHSIGIAVYKAKQAVIDVVRGRRATGSKRGRGGIIDSHTKSTSIFRQSGEGDAYVIEPPDDQTEAEFARIDLTETLRPALAALGERDREIVQALYFEDLTQAEVAAKYGISRQAISQRLRKAYAAMRPVLEGSVA